MRSILKVGLFLGLGCASSAVAQTPVPIPITVSGNQVLAGISLPGGIAADLTITFENVVGLSPGAFDVTATLVNPLDFSLLGRLPGLLNVPGAFPLLLHVGPSASSGLSFAGEYTISLHTYNLQLNPSIPMALFKAPDGGPFQDVTISEGRGSYRADGGGGDFSDFLIVIDLRPIDSVIVGKFNALQGILSNQGGSLPPDVFATLQAQLSQASILYQTGATQGAIGVMSAFSDTVKAHSGDDIPNIWRANDPTRINLAGLLRVGADTLRFSLDRKTGH